LTLILVRHGESEGNAQRIIQGSLDLGLSELGRAQAEAAAARLAMAGASKLYASPLKRAWETAAAIASAIRLEVEAVAALAEYSWGDAQGMTWSAALERWGEASMRWGGDEIPGQELASAFRGRVLGAFEELLARHREGVAIVVTHGGVLTQIVAHVLEIEEARFAPVATLNASLTVVGEDARGVRYLQTLNDSAHLRDLAVTAPPPV
jgi:broad specificity phosphatase PhoE